MWPHDNGLGFRVLDLLYAHLAGALRFLSCTIVGCGWVLSGGRWVANFQSRMERILAHMYYT